MSVVRDLDGTTQKKVVSGQVTLEPTYTETFVGPFNVKLYVRTDQEQIGAITGTATPGATDGTTDLAVSTKVRLHLTVYVTQDGTQKPDTDQTLTSADKCFTDLALTMNGSANRRTGALGLKQDPFTIPNFPDGSADPARTCGLATGALNQQVAGSANAMELNFTGGPTTAH